MVETSPTFAQPDSTGPARVRRAEQRRDDAGVPVCFVLDGDASIRHFLSLVLHGAGVDTEEFADAASFLSTIARQTPDLVFVNIALDSAEAIDCVIALGAQSYSGFVQLMSNRGSAVLEHVRSVGQQHGLQMLPVLKKPFETGAIVKMLRELKLGDPPPVAARIDLDEALANNWIEFWYQPKIHLRKKQLIGVEAFARARHPQNGVLTPGAFMPGASESSLISLSELALMQALRANLKFAEVGVSLRLAVNIPVNALVKMAVVDIIQSFRTKFERWPGVIIDVAEEQIVTDLALAHEITKKLRPLNVHLAIDDFGRGYTSLARLTDLPFAELKLDRGFVADCGSDRVNAPLCKTVIDLAHNFGSIAVGIGIEKAADALALVAMGCDYGQGFLLGQPMPEDRFISLLRQRAAASQPKQPVATSDEAQRTEQRRA
jgi:EAL domain-containing protein (putative c-di-GMP-specific phosphodiesterase class I)